MNDKPDRDMFAMITANNKALYTRIEYLIKVVGNEVTTNHLDTYQINLIECFSQQGIKCKLFVQFYGLSRKVKF